MLETLLSINVVPYAIPVFFLLIPYEIYVTRKRARNQYRVNDTLTCVATGMISQQTGLFGIMLTGVGYMFIYKHFSMTDMHAMVAPAKIMAWLVLLLAQDMLYYWFHRAAHRINIGWGGHVVHHTSEEYNLAVALRQSSLQMYTSWMFYLPLAWIGFPPEWFYSVYSINLVYQFWIHTREIDKLPVWFEAIFNTPSHHRVHHGTNPQYIDKNYAGALIIWDRLFGTFEPEGEEVRYGITVPLRSWNPLWANVHYYWYLIKATGEAPTRADAINLWMKGPEWAPEWLQRFQGAKSAPATAKFDTPLAEGLSLYLVANFIVLMVLVVVLLTTFNELAAVRAVAFIALTIVSLGAIGVVLEGRPWGHVMELARLPVTYVLLPLLVFPSLSVTDVLFRFGLPALFMAYWFSRVFRGLPASPV